VRVGFIDVPGHERFVKNMLAGASGIDLVMLVVAADESIKPQTREHFDICSLLGVKHGLVVITKSDLVDRDLLETVKLEVQEFLSGSFLDGAPVVAVSARNGEGLEELKAELLRLSQAISPKPVGLPFRLPIDRAFVMKGFGTVVTGTLISGSIEKEAEVEVFPSGRRARVRGLEVHNQPSAAALAGQRTALNLAGIEARDVTRGMVLAAPGLFRVTSCLDVSLSLLPSARPLKNRARVHFHCGTAETIAEVVLLDGKKLNTAERTYARLRLAEPGLFLPHDRFIIRQFSPVTTIGGGSILDSQPWTDSAKLDPSVCQFFEILENGDPESCLDALTRQSGEVSLADLVARTGWLPEDVARVAKVVEGKGGLVRTGEPPSLFMHAEYFRALAGSTVKTLEEFHDANPLVPGVSKEELRARVAAALVASAKPISARPQVAGAPEPWRRRVLGRKTEGLHLRQNVLPSVTAFNTILQALSAQGKVDAPGETVMLAGRALRLTPEEANARDQISRAFEKAGLAVPSAAEVLATLRVDRSRAEKILQILLKDKVLVRVAEGLIFHQAALEKLLETVRQRKAQTDRINVASFKEMTGLSRKYVIPLLEYLDRIRVTRRQGDERIIL
jgi:selenocysteine-specific elongation factor